MAEPVVLLVDNTLRKDGRTSDRISLLEEVFRSYPASVRTIHFTELARDIKDGTDAIVLSGSSLNVSEDTTKEKFGHIADLIKRTDLPILGVCFGFHLVMHAYGCNVNRNEASSEFLLPDGRVIEIDIMDENGMVKRGRYVVNVSHRDYVDPDDPALKGRFRVHAVSRDGEFDYLQYASHVDRPVHAIQFHPECYRGAPDRLRETGIGFLHGFLRHTLRI